MHFAVRPALSADSTKIVLVAIDPISLTAVYAMVSCDDIRHVFGVRGASNELLRERASVREANREGISDIANNLFQVGRYTLNQGSHVIDIRREDLIGTKKQFAWDKSDIPGGERQDGSRVDASKFEKEQYNVESLLRLLGYSNFSTSRPDPDQKNETGVDVLVKLGGRRIGFQVTDFHSDEGDGSEHKGSDLRREERRKAVDGLPAAMFVNPNPMAGLIHRIEDKSKKQWSTKDFPEMILLIAASITEVPGIVSTFSLGACLDLNEMNAQLCPILKRTRYSAAYIYNMIQQSVYQWTIQKSWEKIL